MGERGTKSKSYKTTALLVIGFVALGAGLWQVPVNHDSAYLMLAAERYLDGQSFYINQSMANPPLATWMHAFVVWTDRILGSLGIGPFGLQMLVPFVLVAIAMSLSLSALVLAQVPDLDARTRGMYLIAAFAALAVAPMHDFGQRDHLFAVFAFPYVMLIGARLNGARVPRGLGNAIGAFAFFGVALKPHFALLPIALEVLMLTRSQRFGAIFRAETVTLAALVVGYGVSVVTFYPEYFSDVLPRYARVFFAFTQPVPVLLVQSEVIIALFAFLVLAWRGTRMGHGTEGRAGDGVIQAGAVTIAAGAAIFFLQKKGWSYQRVPMFVFSTWTLAALAVSASRARDVTSSTCLWALVGIGLAAILVVLRGPYANVYQGTVARALADESRGDAAYVFTTNVSVAYPGMQYAGVEPASRFNTLWMLPGLVRTQAEDPGALKDIEAFARDAILEDFNRHSPQAVGVDARDPKPYFNGVAFDYLDWALEDPRFARVWSSYTLARRAYGFDIYVRKPEPGAGLK